MFWDAIDRNSSYIKLSQILLSLQMDLVDLFHKQKHSKGFLKYFHFDKSRSITSSQTEYMSGSGHWLDEWTELKWIKREINPN